MITHISVIESNCKVIFDKTKKWLYNKNRKWEPQKCVLPYKLYVKTPQSLAEHMWCFYYLLKITTIAIIKANAIIVIPTKP